MQTSGIQARDKEPELAALLTGGVVLTVSDIASGLEAAPEGEGRLASTLSENQVYQLLQIVETLMDITARGIFWKDRNSVYLGCNRNFAISCGLSDPRDVVGKTDYDLPWPREQAAFFQKIDRLVMSTGQPRYHIIQLQTLANGRNVWVDISKVPLYDTDSQLIGVLGIEGAVHQSGERYVLSEREITVGTWEWEEAHSLIKVDRETKRILGLSGSSSNLSMTEFMRMIHPDDSNQVQSLMEGLFKRSIPSYEKKHRIIRPNGVVRWVQLRGAAFYDAQTRVPKLGGTISDLSAMGLSDHAADNRAAILEAITASSQNLLATVELDEILPDILDILGRAVGYGRAYLLRNELSAGDPGEVLARPHASWSAYTDYIPNVFRSPLPFSYQEMGLEGWTSELRAGRPLYGQVKGFPLRERRYLSNQDVACFIWVPVLCEGEWWGVLGFDDQTERNPRHAEIEALRNAAGAIGSAIARHRSQVAEREQRTLAEALRDTARVLNSTLNLEEVLDRIFSQIGNVVAHDWANIILVEAGRARVVRSRHHPLSSVEIPSPEQEFTVDAFPSLQQMIASGQGLTTSADGDIPFAGEQWGLEWVKSYAGAPIQREGNVIGFINLFSAASDFFQPIHARRLQAFADQAGIAIGNAWLYNQAQELAMLEERQRLARDLHDSVNQTLWTASMLSDVIPALWEQNPEDGRRSLEKLRQLNRAALAEMRALLLELRPAALTSASLSDLMRHLAEATMSRKNVSIQLEVQGDAQLQPEIQVAIYRIAQEALNNVAKHAKANRVRLKLSYDPRWLDLLIADDGRGFDMAQARPAALGLKIMRERAEAIGARLEISSAPGKGTRISITWRAQAGQYGREGEDCE